jgi:hypothetical protein
MRQIRCTVVSIFSFFVLISAAALARAGVVTRCDDYGLRTAMAQGGVVTFGCDGTITLTNVIGIENNVVLDGTGRQVTIDGGGANQIFIVSNGVSFAATNLTIANGFHIAASPYGGAIADMGMVSVVNCTFTNNQVSASNAAGPIYGGAIAGYGGTLTAIGCTFVSNTVPGAGGAIGMIGGAVSLENCTFYGNSAPDGSVLRMFGLGTNPAVATVVNCTIAQNNGTALVSRGSMPGGSILITNDLLVNNAGGDVNGVSDGGYNLVTDGFPTESPLTLNIGALLGPLTNNGGPTMTMALLAGSPGIDAANDAVAPATDQRGVARPIGKHSDIGAYETQAAGGYGGSFVIPDLFPMVLRTATNIVVPVYRVGGVAGPASVQFATSDETAIAGQNYQTTSGTLNFADGQQSNVVVIPILNNPEIPDSLGFILNFFNAIGGPLVSGGPTISIVDPVTEVGFAASNSFAFIESGNAVISVVRWGNTNNAFSVNYSTGDGTAVAGRDYTAVSGTITFAPGQLTNTFNVPVTPIQTPGSNTVLNLTLSNPANASLQTLSNATLTIINDNPAVPGLISRCDDWGLRRGIIRGGVLTFACDTTITLTNSIEVTTNVVLDGTGHHVTIDGAGTNQMFYVSSQGSFVATNLVFANGLGTNNAGGGVGIFGSGSIVNCTFSNNQSSGLTIWGTATVAGCTFVSNSTPGSFGGAVSVAGNGKAFVENSTFFGNVAYDGSALALLPGGAASAKMVNCTIAYNHGLALGGWYSGLHIVNCLMVSNFLGTAIGALDDGYNISSDDAAGLTNDLSLNNANVLLGPFTNNGGLTETMALLPASPGVDAGNDLVAPAIDQRGMPRPFGRHADIGAYELQSLGTFSGVLEVPTNIGVIETASNVVVPVFRLGGTAGSVSVHYSTGGGTAIAGTNYQPISGTVSFADGQASNAIVLPILDNPVIQNDLTLSLIFSNPTGAELATNGTAITNGTAVIPITIYEALSGVSLASGNIVTNYDAGNAVITLVRAGNLSNSFSVNYATSNGTAIAGRDYTGTSGTASFSPGQSNVAINVAIAPTVRRGSNETIDFYLSNPTNAILLEPSNAVLTVVNTNAPLPGVFSFSNATVGASAALGGVVVGVVRSQGSDGTVTVHYATANGTAIAGKDYTATSGNLTFADLQQGTESIYIPINLENSSGVKTFKLSLSSPTGGATLGAISTVTISVVYGSQTLSNATDASFRSAVLSGGSVTFASDANITLTNLITVTNGVLIDGGGHNVIINGASNQIFSISPGSELGLRNLTLTNGYAAGLSMTNSAQGGLPGYGGAVSNNGGVLMASNCLFTGNGAIGGNGSDYYGFGGNSGGGAIFNTFGEVFATNCEFVANFSQGGSADDRGGSAQGGAIVTSNGLVILSSCIFSGNRAYGGGAWRVTHYPGGQAEGGAILGTGGTPTLILENCRLDGNSSPSGGGVCLDAGILSVSSCVLSNNNAAGGGGIFTAGTASVTNTIFIRNGGNDGGAIDIAGSLYMENCALVANTAVNPYNELTRPPGLGGAVYNGAAFSAVNCTFANNVADGTYYGASGGAIYNGSIAILNQVTIVSNTVEGGIRAPQNGGGIASAANAYTILENSILASNTTFYYLYQPNAFSTNAPANYSGGLADFGNNLSSDSTAPFTSPGSRTNVDPMLGPLAYNGGPTPTMALLPGSPAIGAENVAYQTATDQRGVARPAGRPGDIGAFELTPASGLFPGGQTGNVYAISFLGTAGQQIEIDLSTNLASWTPYVTNLVGTNGVFEIFHTNNSAQAGTFYRAVVH